jgi:protein transport protein SEC24
VDPSLTAQAPPQPHDQQGYQDTQQPYQQQQPYYNSNANPILHPVSDRRTPPPTGQYAPVYQTGHQNHQQSRQNGQPEQLHPSFIPPSHHIPAPPHSSGPSITGPRVRIDPSQMPNPIEAQEMDQNLYDDEDFLSCQTKGVIPLAGTDWRGVDQGR